MFTTSSIAQSHGPLRVNFKIHQLLRVGNHNYALLVIVDIIKAHIPAKGLEKEKRAVAKIYDLLYAADEGASSFFYPRPDSIFRKLQESRISQTTT